MDWDAVTFQQSPKWSRHQWGIHMHLSLSLCLQMCSQKFTVIVFVWFLRLPLISNLISQLHNTVPQFAKGERKKDFLLHSRLTRTLKYYNINSSLAYHVHPNCLSSLRPLRFVYSSSRRPANSLQAERRDGRRP